MIHDNDRLPVEPAVRLRLVKDDHLELAEMADADGVPVPALVRSIVRRHLARAT